MRKRSRPVLFGPHKWPIVSTPNGDLLIQVSKTETVVCAAENADWLIRQLTLVDEMPHERRIADLAKRIRVRRSSAKIIPFKRTPAA